MRASKAIFVLENFAHVVEQALTGLSLDLVIVVKPGDCLGLQGNVIVNLVSRYVKKSVQPYSIPAKAASPFQNCWPAAGRSKSPIPVSNRAR